MRTFWHFLKSNIAYNKLELAISYTVTGGVFALYFFFKGSKREIDGEMLLSVAFYALLYAFFSNKKKFNLKYLVSLPMSKSKLLWVKCCGDIVFFLPAMSLAFVAAKSSNLAFDTLPLMVLLVQGCVLISFFLFDSDVEQPRVENSRASFVNRLVYVRKMVDTAFLVSALALLGSAAYAMPMSASAKQRLFVIGMFFVLAFKYKKSLALMQDESLSYFIFRRDAFKSGWKLGLLSAPAIALAVLGPQAFFPSRYGKSEIFDAIRNKDKQSLSRILSDSLSSQKEFKAKGGFTPILASILEGNGQALELLLGSGFQIDWNPSISDKQYQGFLPPHLAAVSNNPEVMQKVLSLKSSALDLPLEKTKDTPLMVAVNSCANEMVDFLLKKGADPNAQNARGETPLILSVKRGCDASTALLLEYRASAAIKDKEGKVALDHMRKNDTMYYYVKRKTPLSPPKMEKRAPASAPASSSL